MFSSSRTLGTVSYRLDSELARLGLRAIEPDPNRKLAWVNSICFLFLLVGLVGAKRASTAVKALPPVEEASSVIVEPLPLPPQTITPEPAQEQPDDLDTPDTPQVVVVTPETPNISFAVPTIGNILVPNTLAKAPPVTPLKQVAPLPIHTEPSLLNSTGRGGARPQPPYPQIALEQGQQGSVVLRMTVNDAGGIESIEVAKSSGHPVLDHSALEFVKRHWTVPPGSGTRIYEAPINYLLSRE